MVVLVKPQFEVGQRAGGKRRHCARPSCTTRGGGKSQRQALIAQAAPSKLTSSTHPSSAQKAIANFWCTRCSNPPMSSLSSVVKLPEFLYNLFFPMASPQASSQKTAAIIARPDRPRSRADSSRPVHLAYRAWLQSHRGRGNSRIYQRSGSRAASGNVLEGCSIL